MPVTEKSRRNLKPPFQKGVSGNPSGHPQIKRLSEFRTAFWDAVTLQDVLEVLETLKVCAIDGQPWAVQKFLEYAVGDPETARQIAQEAAQQGLPLTTAVSRILAQKSALEALLRQDEDSEDNPENLQ